MPLSFTPGEAYQFDWSHEVVVLNASEKETPLAETFGELKGKDRVVVIIGGFSKGDFRSDLSKFKHKDVSFGPRMQKVWTVTYKVISAIAYAGCEGGEKAEKAKATKPSKPRRAPKKKAE